MGTNSEISWTDHTWNPWRGCKKITAGCANCYMFTAQSRYGKNPHEVVRCGPGVWRQPDKWARESRNGSPRGLVFTCSWSDFFIEDADPWRRKAWDVIFRTQTLNYQILTKRPERIMENLPIDWAWDGAEFWDNVWLGVSVENRKQGLQRIDILREIPAAVRFLSIEPLLEDLGEINLDGIDWVIVGGESGAGYRPMRKEWAESVAVQCASRGVPFWFKQDSGPRPGMRTDLLGRVLQEFPR